MATLITTRLVETISLKTNAIERLRVAIKDRTGARELLGQWADTYLEYLHVRHQNEGYDTWPSLKERTKKDRRNKKKRGNPSSSTKILQDTMQLLAVTAKNGRGQERRLDVPKLEVRAGVDRSTRYRDPRLKGRRPAITLAALMDVQARGAYPGGSPRPVIVAPDEATRATMRSQAEAWVKNSGR